MLNLRPPRPYVIGHRGARGHAPENTLGAFRKGFDLGSDLVECDVHLTRDDQIVVFHDDTLERTTDGSGLLRDRDLAELKRLDAGGGERIPTLDELLELVRSRPPLGVVIEIKNGPHVYPALSDVRRMSDTGKPDDRCFNVGHPGIAAKVAAAIDRFGLAERALVISFDHLVVLEHKRLRPDVATGILYVARLADPAAAARAAGADSIWPALAFLTPEVTQAAHRADLGVFTWTANSDGEISRALEAGADGVGSDFPDALAARVAAAAPPG